MLKELCDIVHDAEEARERRRAAVALFYVTSSWGTGGPAPEKELGAEEARPIVHAFEHPGTRIPKRFSPRYHPGELRSGPLPGRAAHVAGRYRGTITHRQRPHFFDHEQEQAAPARHR